MRNLTLIFAMLFFGWSVSASENFKSKTSYSYNYNDSFIFVEGGVEFAIYPNGEFDFYFNPNFRRGNSFHLSTPNVNISYNSGYNYDPYVQYDDYGAVIQIENVPIYYDYYGRIVQAGNIYLSYNNFGRLARVGNLYVHYNHAHRVTHYSGFINNYNRRYVYRPWHDYYRRPNVNVSVVFGSPYRAYYEPRRISYNKYVTVYNNYYVNKKRKKNFYRPSQKVRSYNHGRRTASRRDIAYTKHRSDFNKPATRKSVAKNRVYSDRSKVNGNDRKSKSQTRGPVYSDRNESGTNSRGRSSRIDNSKQKRQASTGERSVRTQTRQTSGRNYNKESKRVNRAVSTSKARKVQSRSNSRVEQKRTVSRNRTIDKSNRTSERKSSVERPTRQRSTSVRTRSNSGNSRSKSIRTKKSSRSQSSARNMNNR